MIHADFKAQNMRRGWKFVWQPIKTAPRDGENVLLWWFGRPVIGSWLKRGEWCDETLGTYDEKPTHWMPLPEPPA